MYTNMYSMVNLVEYLYLFLLASDRHTFLCTTHSLYYMYFIDIMYNIETMFCTCACAFSSRVVGF